MANARNTNIAPAPNHTPTISDTVPKYLNTPTLLALAGLWILLGRQEGNLDLGGGNRICMVLEWTLGLKRLAYSRIDLSLCCTVSLHLKTQNHQTFCVSLVLVSFTLIYGAACSLLVKHSTIITSEERASEIPSCQLLGT